ncbi:hypothetical protein FB451DRAFT_1281065 [Mycena latifolia]|nr:hypothetical protein FB451DRAFT_1281065 [Mycena latifolia]
MAPSSSGPAGESEIPSSFSRSRTALKRSLGLLAVFAEQGGVAPKVPLVVALDARRVLLGLAEADIGRTPNIRIPPQLCLNVEDSDPSAAYVPMTDLMRLLESGGWQMPQLLQGTTHRRVAVLSGNPSVMCGVVGVSHLNISMYGSTLCNKKERGEKPQEGAGAPSGDGARKYYLPRKLFQLGRNVAAVLPGLNEPLEGIPAVSDVLGLLLRLRSRGLRVRVRERELFEAFFGG